MTSPTEKEGSFHDRNLFQKTPTLPPEAYIVETMPFTEPEGRTLYLRALSLKREFAQRLWLEKEEILGIKDRNDFGVAVIPSERRVQNKKSLNGDIDATDPLIRRLKEKQLGVNPVAVYSDSHFSNDIEAQKKLLGESDRIPETIYLVASAVDEKDFSKIRTVANHMKNVLHVKKVSLLLTFMGFGREDKNAQLVDGQLTYNRKMLTLAGEVVGWGQMIDQVRFYEPHSSFIQAILAEQGVPCAPISLWKVGAQEIKKDKNIDKNKIVVMGPDVGRNKAAKAIGDYFNAPVVGVNKHRDPDTGIISFDPLKEDQKKAVMGEDGKGGKEIVLYDDEGASLGTAADIVEGVINNYSPKSVSIVLAHRRFTEGFWDNRGVWHDGWQHHLNRILQAAKKKGVKLNIYLTDSREPIGDIEPIIEKHSQNIKVISLTDKIIEDIQFDVEGADPWSDERTQDTIL